MWRLCVLVAILAADVAGEDTGGPQKLQQQQTEPSCSDGGRRVHRHSGRFGYADYDTDRIDFAPRVREGLGFGLPLDQLHDVLLEPDGYGLSEEDRSFYDEIPIFGENDRDSVFVKRFYKMYDADPSWERLYLRFVRDVVQPQLFPNETSLVVQHTPNLRVHITGQSNIGRRPGRDPSEDIIGLHRDQEFGHRHDELNIVVPLTAMWGTNSIYYEPAPDSGVAPEDFAVVTTVPGRLFFGDLNSCHHYNKINSSGKTRVSLDFRVVPASSYGDGSQDGDLSNGVTSATSGKKFKVGDYYRMVDCEGDTGEK